MTKETPAGVYLVNFFKKKTLFAKNSRYPCLDKALTDTHLLFDKITKAPMPSNAFKDGLTFHRLVLQVSHVAPVQPKEHVHVL